MAAATIQDDQRWHKLDQRQQQRLRRSMYRHNQAIASKIRPIQTKILVEAFVTRINQWRYNLTYQTSAGALVEGSPRHPRFNLVKNNANRFWVGTDGGIWRSDDGGTNYVNMNSNLNVTLFYDVAVDFIRRSHVRWRKITHLLDARPVICGA